VGVIGIDPDYFWNEMSPDEIESIMTAKTEADRILWEQTRTICYYNYIAMNGSKITLEGGAVKKIESPTDLFSFPWDKKKK
jgi:hypothetical protein